MRIPLIVGLALSLCGIAVAQVAPTITTPPSSLTVTQGSAASFSVVASGDEPLAYQWRKNGSEVFGANATAYAINAAQPSDAGNYDVVVTNLSGAATSTVATLTVLVPPSITSDPSGVSVVQPNTATLSVVAQGTALTYRWYQNGVALSDGGHVAGSTTPTLTVANASLIDAGAYTVVVTGSAGAVTSAVANVTVQPTMTAAFFDFNNQGQFTNNFALSFAGLISPWTFWDTNGATTGVAGTRGLDFSSGAAGTDSTAVFTNRSFDFSRDGAVLNCSGMVKIKAPGNNSATLQLGFVNTKARLNGDTRSAFISARVNSTAQPALSFAIQHQTKVQSGTATVSGTASANSSLTAGNWYKVTATFTNIKASAANSFVIAATVQDMGANGTTPGAIVLTQSPLVVTNSEMVSDDSVFFAVRSFDNAGADALDNLAVWVNSAPTVLAPLANATVLEGRYYAYSAVVDGNAPTNYQWFKNGAPISGANDWTYVIKSASQADAGDYSVQVNGGAVTSTVSRLTVTPAGPTPVSVGSVDGYTVGLRFDSPVDVASATTPANYSVSGSTVYGVSMRDNRTIILLLGTRIFGPFTVQVSGVKGPYNTLGTSTNLSGTAQQLTSIDLNGSSPVGSTFSAAPGDVEMTAGGSDFWGTADVGRAVGGFMTGDFDVVAQVASESYAVVSAGDGAKTGLAARDTLDPSSINIDVYTMPDFPGLNRYETGLRSSFAAGSGGWGVDPAGDSVSGGMILANHPNAWLRLRRVGNTFASYSSTNGTDWRLLGLTAVAARSSMFVGPILTAHVQNQQVAALLKNYGSFSGYPGATLSWANDMAVRTTNVTAGQSAQLTSIAAVSGAPGSEILYTWQRQNNLGVWTNLSTGFLTASAGGTINSNTFVLNTTPLYGADSGAQFRCIAKVTGAGAITSQVATVTVTDSTVPTVTAVPTILPGDANQIIINFSEVMGASALDISKYTVTNSSGQTMALSSAAFLNGDLKTVVLTTIAPLTNSTYGVVFNGVQDQAGNSVAANTVKTFLANTAPTAPVVHEIYQDIGGGTTVDILTNHAMFKAATPTFITYSNIFGFNVNWAGVQDSYGVRSYTYFVPPTNGAYKFWIRSDDGAMLMMNTSGTNPAGKVTICQNTNAQANYVVGTSNVWTLQSSITNITLVGGQRYYMEMLLKEGSGNDGFSVMWTDPSVTTAPATNSYIPYANLAYPIAAAAAPVAYAEIYNVNVGGAALSDLANATNVVAFISRIPTVQAYEKSFAFQPGSPSNANLANSRYDNYVGRITTYLTPPTNGNYKFWVRSDDSCQIWINTNAVNSLDPAGAVLVGSMNSNNSTYQLVASNITLTGGQTYYLEGRWKDGTGGDGMQVALRSNNDTGRPNQEELISTSFLRLPTNTCSRIGPVTIAGVRPTGTNIYPGQTVTLYPAGIGGSSWGIGYTWLRDGVVVGNGSTYTTPPLGLSDNGATYTFVVTNLFSAASASTTVGVINDTVQPLVVNAIGTRVGDGLTLYFSEPLDNASALISGNYSIAGLNITAVSIDTTRTKVFLSTSAQTAGTTYTVVINGVRDLAGNTVPGNSTISFTAWSLGGSGLFVEMFTNISGTAVSSLTGDTKYVNNAADETGYVTSFGFGTAGTVINNFTRYTSGTDNYGLRISGYFNPPTNGFYRFFIRSDDASQLFMNTNGPSYAGRVLLCREDLNTHNYDAGSPTNNGVAASIGPWVYLTNGTRYYMEGLLKEGTGSDFIQVAMRTGYDLASLDTSIPPTSETLPGQFFTPFGNPDTIKLVLNTAWASDVYVTEMNPVTLTLNTTIPAAVRNSTSVRWQRAEAGSGLFNDIPGATSLSYSTVARLSDDLVQYRLIVDGPAITTNYTVTLHVAADTEPPILISVGSLDGSTLVMTYNKAVETNSAREPFNYEVTGVNGDWGIPLAGNYTTGIILDDLRSVLFYIDPGVVLPDVLDVHAFGIASQAQSASVGESWASGRVEHLTGAMVGLPNGNSAGNFNPLPSGSAYNINGTPFTGAFAVTNGGINVSANGYDIWTGADSFHYVSRPVTGNFDVKVRVQNFAGADQWSKAGLMARGSLTNSSRYMFMGLVPATSPLISQAPINNYVAQWRDYDGASAAPSMNSLNTGTNPPAYPNAWLRLQRLGSVFNGYISSNGVDWVLYLSRDTATNAGGAFPTTLYLGLATASHDQTRNLANNAYVEYRNLDLPMPPVITAQPTPADSLVPVHANVTFSGVTASGQGPITFQWTKNGAFITGATNDSLVLTNVAVTDSATYAVIAQNNGGGVLSSNCVLLVSNALPVVAGESFNVNEGTPRTFTVGELLGNDVDPEGDALTLLGVSGVAPVTLRLDFNAGAPTNAAFYAGGANGSGFLGGRWVPSGGVNDSGNARLTDGGTNLQGGLVINELTPRRRVQAFTASFMLRIGDGSGEPADGFSFDFASDLPNGTSGAAENGVGTGFAFGVDNYRFLPYVGVGTPLGGGASSTANSSGMKLMYNGTNIAGVAIPSAWNSPRWVPVKVTVSADGVATVFVDGTNAFGNVTLPGYTAKTGRFGFFARTGGQYASYAVDDVALTVLTIDSARDYNLAGSVYGDAYVSGVTGVPASGYLHLTDAVNSQMGAYVLSDLVGGAAVQSFNASFKLRIGNGTSDAADGMSFNFGSDLVSGTSAAAEEGVGTGLSICVDNYPGSGVSNAPAVKVKFGGVELGYTKIPKWNSTNWVPANVALASDGTVTVTLDGTNTITIATPYTARAGRFGFYARTGGQNATHWVDDLSIAVNTAAGSRPFAENFNTGGPAQVTYANGTVTYNPADSTCGTDTFYYLVSDGQSGGAVWDTVSVTIVPTNGLQPTVVMPVPSQSVVLDSGCQFTLPDLRGQLVASGNCISVSQSPAAGTLLGSGPHTVTFTVTDSQGQTATSQTTVTGVDTIAPVITVPVDVIAEATSADGATVTFTPTAADNCTVASLVSSPASGAVFPIGTNSVTVTAADLAGNASTNTFLVIVRDTIAPSITCPDTIMATADDENGAVVTFTVHAFDQVTSQPTIVSVPASGSVFPLGTNTVTTVAMDAAGNTNTCSFLVVVEQTSVAPQLAVAVSETNIVVSWPASTSAAFVLQQSSDLSSPTNWVNSAVSINATGTVKSAVIPSMGEAKFFRLRKP